MHIYRVLSHGLHASLRIFSLSNLPSLSRSSLVHIGGLTALRTLNISKCPSLDGEALECLVKLTNLESLTLAWNLHATDTFLCKHAVPQLLQLTCLELRSIHVLDNTLSWLQGEQLSLQSYLSVQFH